MKSFKQFLKEDWWSDLGKDGQDSYIANHPNSKKAKEAKAEQEKNNSNSDKNKPYTQRQQIKGVKKVEIPHFTEEEIRKAKREPYIFTPEGQKLYNNYIELLNSGETEKAKSVEAIINTNNKKYNIESVSHLKGALSSEKYYVDANDFNNPNGASTFDILTVKSLNDDGTYDFAPMGSRERINSNNINKNLIELDKDQAKQLFTTMPGKDGPFGGLSHSEEELVKTYTYATPENSALRQGKKSQRAEKMKNIIDRCYNRKSNVYRGIKGEYAEKLLSLRPGDTITEPGFSSTTGNIDIAKTFGKNGVVLDIDVPEGWGNMIDVNDYTTHPEEDEKILNSNAKFKVESIKDNVIKVKLLPFEQN